MNYKFDSIDRIRGDSSGSRFVLDLFWAFPQRTLNVFMLLVLSGMMEGIGVASVLPLISTIGQGNVGDSTVERGVMSVFGLLGFEPTVGAFLVLVVIGISCKALMTLIAMRNAGFAVAQVATDLRLKFLSSLFAAKWRYFTNQPVGTFANAVSTEVDMAARAYNSACYLMASAIQVIIYAVLAVTMSWQLTVAAVLAGAIMVFLMSTILGYVRALSAQEASAIDTLLGKVVDGFNAFKPLKAMGREYLLEPILEKQVVSVNDARQRLVVANEAIRVIPEPFMVLFLAGGMYVAIQYFSINFELLVMMAFLFYRTVGNMGSLYRAFQQIVQYEGFMNSFQKKIKETQLAKEEFRGIDAPVFKNAIIFDDVSFAYGEHPILQGADMEIRAGELTALIGPSGSGKSTIVDLLIGLNAAGSGNIRVDDMPLDNINLFSWRHELGYVPQEISLFNDTILNNVTLGDQELREEDAIIALRLAGLEDFVNGLECGLHHVIGERGAMLSGGQRQRIAIARALVRKPRLLILDEATTALDPTTERHICETIASLKGQVTILAVSHQPAIVEIADSVYQLKDSQTVLAPH